MFDFYVICTAILFLLILVIVQSQRIASLKDQNQALHDLVEDLFTSRQEEAGVSAQTPQEEKTP
jgi:hypothetical protein